MKQQAKTILGIDPGYGRLGWAIGRKVGSGWEKIELGCIETSKDQDLYQRYSTLEKELQKIIDQYQPTEAGIETLFFVKNQKTAMAVSESRGVVIATLIRNKIKVFQYAPNQIKSTVAGHGKADKRAVEKMLRMEFSLPNNVLDDALDALAVVLTHSVQQGSYQRFLA
ncbi:MAG: crossover junction endodeoxyribonuclease RuvC [Candidatus Pacebacteria bacterium]|nr:crossover junction endodeoxyribonuclease RuvC [Candidatus Paceibacterota bacterium]